MNASYVSWECLQCGMPNFSTAIFSSTYSVETENKLSTLRCSVLGSPVAPTFSSSPKVQVEDRYK